MRKYFEFFYLLICSIWHNWKSKSLKKFSAILRTERGNMSTKNVLHAPPNNLQEPQDNLAFFLISSFISKRHTWTSKKRWRFIVISKWMRMMLMQNWNFETEKRHPDLSFWKYLWSSLSLTFEFTFALLINSHSILTRKMDHKFSWSFITYQNCKLGEAEQKLEKKEINIKTENFLILYTSMNYYYVVSLKTSASNWRSRQFNFQIWFSIFE